MASRHERKMKRETEIDGRELNGTHSDKKIVFEKE